MKKRLSYFLSMSTLLIGISCTSILEVPEITPETESGKVIESIQVCVHDFVGSENITRTVIDITEKGASFNWGKNDTIGIFPTNGYQVAFPMSLGTGTQNAEFDGSDWALKASKKYVAYYPFDYENRSYKNIAISYLGQRQNGNGTTDHLGKYDYMAADITTPSEGNVAFDFQHLGALVQWKLTMPEGGKFTKLTLRCGDEVFTQTGVLDMSQNTTAINSEQKHKRINMDLENIETYPQGQIIIYMMMPPTDLSGKKFSIIMTNENGEMRAAQLDGKKIEAGKAYSIAAEDFEYYEEDVLEMIGNPLKLANGTRDTLTLEYNTNQPLTYTISDEAKDWISLIECGRAATPGNMQFDIKENPTEANRKGTITITSLNGDSSLTYTILQGRTGSYAITQEKGCVPPFGFIYCNYPAINPEHGLYAIVDNNPETYFEVETQSLEIIWECLEPFHMSTIWYDTTRGKHNIFMASLHYSDDGINWYWNGMSWGIPAGNENSYTAMGFNYDYYNNFYKVVVSSNHGAPTTQITGIKLEESIE